MVLLATFMILDISVYIDTHEIINLIITEALFAIMMSHNILSITIYIRWYPNQQIPKAASTLYRISEVGCWICLLILLAGLLLYISMPDENRQMTTGIYIVLISCFTLIASFVIQIIGGQRMVKTINRNARLQFENSFV